MRPIRKEIQWKFLTFMTNHPWKLEMIETSILAILSLMVALFFVMSVRMILIVSLSFLILGSSRALARHFVSGKNGALL